jgi:predicted nucleic acid-binding protein
LGVNAKKLDTDVPKGTTLTLDTNVLISYLEGGQATSDAAELIIDDWIYHGRNHGIISAVSVVELLVGPIRANAPIADYLNFLQRFPNITCAPVDFRAAEAAAKIRAKSSAKSPDALIIGTAIACNAEMIVTNDQAWASISPIPVLKLHAYTSGQGT